MKKHHLSLLLCFTVHSSLYAQEKIGAQLYKYFRTEPAIQPVASIQWENNWHTELRYNYEAAQTLSVYAGKKIDLGTARQMSFTPMLGFSGGPFTGVTAACNAEISWRKIFFSSDNQYSISLKKNSNSFFFNWSELGYNLCNNFYAGVSMQYNKETNVDDLKAGFLFGTSFKNFQVPVYVFRPLQSSRCFVIGLVYDYNIIKKR